MNIIQKIKDFSYIIAIILAIFGALKIYESVNLKKAIEQEKVNVLAAQEKTITWKDKYLNLHSKSIEIGLSYGRLVNSQDSIDKLIVNVINQNKINKRKLDEVGYILNKITARSITYLDTNYITVKKDTCIIAHNNQWLSETVCLTHDSLYTDIIAISEDVLLFKNSKVTEDTPKKWWIQRLFQKKINIVEVEIINNNPYIVLKNQKFTHIIK